MKITQRNIQEYPLQCISPPANQKLSKGFQCPHIYHFDGLLSPLPKIHFHRFREGTNTKRKKERKKERKEKRKKKKNKIGQMHCPARAPAPAPMPMISMPQIIHTNATAALAIIN